MDGLTTSASVRERPGGTEGPITAQEHGSMATLDELAGQMRFYSDGSRNDYLHMCMNLLQCGRVMTEAKGRVPHGQWESWVEENSGFSFRTAETYMQAYQTYGLNPDIAKLGKTKMIRLLPVPEDIRTKVLEEHDLGSMSTREIEKILREEKQKAAEEARASTWAEAGEKLAAQREEIEKNARAEIQAARAEAAEAAALENLKRSEEDRARIVENALKDSERRIEAARKEAEEAGAAELAEKDRTIAEQQAEIQRLADQARETMEALNDGTRDLRTQNADLTAKVDRLTERLESSTKKYIDLKDEYLALQSTIQKGDAERAPADELTPEVMAQAVRSFIGAVARMPHMSGRFAMMAEEERENYDTLLRTVEDWARNARRALDTVSAGGVMV